MVIRYTETFKRQLKRLSKKYRHIRTDVAPVIDQLLSGETPGDQVQGTGYIVYKARIKNTDSSRGKSGGYRLLYYLQNEDDVRVLLIYSKSEQSDIEATVVREMINSELGV